MFLKSCGVKEVSNLNPGQKEEFRLILKKTVPMGYKLLPNFYDIRFTKQVEGKEDLVEDPKAIEEIDWFENGPETPISKKISEGMIKVISDSGVKLNYAADLGGARGVARLNGTIDVLDNTPYNPDFASTLIHEFAHECLHLNYLKLQNKTEWAEYFIENEQKRGPVEQQAELTAWLVLKGFGINLHQSINYMGCWGLDKSNAVNVFDAVARLAEKITVELRNKLGTMNESIQRLHEITGRELAQMLGLSKLYDYGDKIRKQKQNKNNKLNMENKRIISTSHDRLYEAINEAVDKALSEAFENEGAFDFMRGAGAAIGNKFKNAGQRIANNVSNAAKNAGNAISKQYNDVKRAGQMASAQAEIDKIINYIKAKASQGVFGKSGDPFYRQVNAAIATLERAAKAKKNQDFGN